MPPLTVAQFERCREEFEAFLLASGAILHPRTNPYEVLRFSTAAGVSVIYRNKHGHISSWGDVAQYAWAKFKAKQPWNAAAPTKNGPRRRNEMLWALARRDGWECFYCGCELTEATATIEHLVAKQAGGPNHASNLVLSCRTHNAQAGHEPVLVKIKMREELRKNMGNHISQR